MRTNAKIMLTAVAFFLATGLVSAQTTKTSEPQKTEQTTTKDGKECKKDGKECKKDGKGCKKGEASKKSEENKKAEEKK